MSTPERRSRMRFPLQTDLKFQVIRRGQGKLIQGTGAVLNMSSKGLAFRSSMELARGVRLSVSLAWPAVLDQKCRLRLVLEGTIIRSEGDCTVLAIESHEFRTNGRASDAAREEMATVTQHLDQIMPARLQ